MLQKNYPEPLVASDDADRGAATPHRIRIPSADDNSKGLHNANSGINNNQISEKPSKVKRGRRSVIAVTHGNHKVTEYFQARRSVRKCKKTVLEEMQKDLEYKVLNRVEDGLQVRNFIGKGRGVVTTKPFSKGEFVVEYSGDLIDQAQAKKRESKYSKDQSAGCYMYYFVHRNQHYCVDATAETNKLGRLVNHSRNGNLVTRIVEVGKEPHLVLIAKEDIPANVEITYDYGDRSKESIRNYPWLAL